jgi:tRNA dimethylallyltransferase
MFPAAKEAVAGRRRVICLVGPTGCGKSDLAATVADMTDGVVINADSRQVYRDFPIITAQPDARTRQRTPHRLYGWLRTEPRLSAGHWARLAAGAAATALEQGKTPILAGGTGLYVRALLDGLADIPAVPQAVRMQVLDECARRGTTAMHARLAACDPGLAGRLHPNDRQRILRGLEVWQATGRPLSAWQREAEGAAPDWEVLRLGLFLPLADLKPVLKARIEAMLAAGAVEEARAAWSRCPNPDAPGWTGIGCAEMLACAQGSLPERALLDAWLRRTRAYAKRQLTWFRADPRIVWFTPGARTDALEAVAAFLR